VAQNDKGAARCREDNKGEGEEDATKVPPALPPSYLSLELRPHGRDQEELDTKPIEILAIGREDIIEVSRDLSRLQPYL
jgi:hypothetical protein